MKIANNIDLLGNQLLRARAHNVAAFTSLATGQAVGRIEYNTESNRLAYWNGTIWVELTPSSVTGSGLISVNLVGGSYQVSLPMTEGHFIVGGAGGAATSQAKSIIPISGFGPAGADVSFGNYRITNLADPVSDTDGANKRYVDAARAGLDVKQSVRVATISNINLSNPGTNLIDSVTLVSGNRVLVKNQSTQSQNGIYIWNGISSAMTRSTDADESSEVTAGFFTFIEEGATHADTGWVLTTDNPITLGTTALSFAQFSSSNAPNLGAGSGILISSGSIHFAATSYTTNTIPLATGANTIGFISAGAANAVLRVPSAGGAPAFGAVNLESTSAVTGTLPVGNGGTGRATLTTNGLLYGNGTSAIGMVNPPGVESILISNNNAPSWVTSLPAAVQANITQIGGVDTVGGSAVNGNRVARILTANIPTGTTSIAITHYFNSRDLHVFLKTATHEYLLTDFTSTSATQVTLYFGAATTEAYTAVIIG
jgi:hypothetical protein